MTHVFTGVVLVLVKNYLRLQTAPTTGSFLISMEKKDEFRNSNVQRLAAGKANGSRAAGVRLHQWKNG